MRGFWDFIRKQGVMGLAVGFILGNAVSDLIGAIVEDVINPLIGIFLGKTEGLKAATFGIASAEIKYGDLIAVLIDFLAIALVVYYGVKWLRLDQRSHLEEMDRLERIRRQDG